MLGGMRWAVTVSWPAWTLLLPGTADGPLMHAGGAVHSSNGLLRGCSCGVMQA